MASNPRTKNGNARRKLRSYFKSLGLPCAICGRPIDYSLPAYKITPWGSRIYNDWAYELDEIIPCSLAETYGYANKTQACLDRDNLQPVHRICNRLKSNKYIGGNPNVVTNKSISNTHTDDLAAKSFAAGLLDG